MEYIDKIRQAAAKISVRCGINADTAIVLGSGLGALADEITEKTEIAYPEIPGFPVSTVAGHAGKLICGKLCTVPVICLSGRFHYYEGYSFKETAFYVHVLKMLGVKRLILTNAAGGVNTDFVPGDLMLITDHIKFTDESPLRGRNYDEIGPRFNDMSDCYTKALYDGAYAAAKRAGVDLKKGVYAFMPGPSYETPAEIRMLRVLGADAVGMSTVPEAIAATHCGMKLTAISCITNMAAGILEKPLSHEEVFETAKSSGEKFRALIKELVKERFQ